jgi:hypothetical protein
MRLCTSFWTYTAPCRSREQGYLCVSQYLTVSHFFRDCKHFSSTDFDFLSIPDLPADILFDKLARDHDLVAAAGAFKPEIGAGPKDLPFKAAAGMFLL